PPAARRPRHSLPLQRSTSAQVRTHAPTPRRMRAARLGHFKQLSDYDWHWPRRIDRAAVEDLMTLSFMRGDNYGGRFSDDYDGRWGRPSGPVVGRGEAPTGERV
ncbi:ATP-binding protein, partial [Mesorhizobium sp. M1233]